MDNSKHSTAALSVNGPSALGIVLAGVAAANAATDHYENRERAEKDSGGGFPANYFKRAASEQCTLYLGLQDFMSYLPATNLFEATAQVAQAMNVISSSQDDFPDDEKINVALRRMEETVSRLLHSAIRAMESAGNFSLEEMGLSGIRGSNLDPWADTDVVVARLQGEGVK